jgi:hypothetical protein
MEAPDRITQLLGIAAEALNAGDEERAFSSLEPFLSSRPLLCAVAATNGRRVNRGQLQEALSCRRVPLPLLVELSRLCAEFLSFDDGFIRSGGLGRCDDCGQIRIVHRYGCFELCLPCAKPRHACRARLSTAISIGERIDAGVAQPQSADEAQRAARSIDGAIGEAPRCPLALDRQAGSTHGLAQFKVRPTGRKSHREIEPTDRLEERNRAMSTSPYLSSAEVAALAELEDERGRGESVVWDEPKIVKGAVVRDVEVVSFTDKNDGSEKTKRVITLRTEQGLAALWEGPAKLTSRLFEGEQYHGEKLGPPVKGQLLLVEFKGERLSGTSGRAYKDFDVVRGPVPQSTPEAGIPY